MIVAAARYQGMDAFTVNLPANVRTAVAELALRNAGHGKDSAKGTDRAIKLDPESADAWSRRCHGYFFDETKYDQAACRRAIALDPSTWNYNGLGTAQEQAKDYCAAEEAYTSAIRTSSNDATSLRNMARAALRCGHVGASVAGFEVAESLDAKSAEDPEEDDDDIKIDLLSDREYLAVAYDKTNQSAKATAVCNKAHPDWKACRCELTDAAVKCSNAPAVSASRK
jgi:tetratricopeptide (TPR) repeat protein